ncbi:hypothetical protein [Mucilaginibacter myungsuensis]|uniref:Uncharacterized protein n=1 Tax=Mucilaginibacter myungsuensis TaxID=649104 RepID=A0A929KYZ9_9SPHI|nr:hypothetical protein [Mucilaginibacter myungsuensis]MBE9660271.1 hypothetical protein [Mucilaginibacter myungsuensis]MDN3600313.1 hypothetical protein [Mucilaginibacter myungsuensis]
MEVLSNTSEVLEFSANKIYLKDRTYLPCDRSGSMTWLPMDDDTFTLLFNYQISAKGLKYKSRLTVNAKLGNVDDDALQVSAIIKGFQNETIERLKQELPSVDFTLPHDVFYQGEHCMAQIKRNLEDVLALTPNKDLTEEERQARQMINDIHAKVSSNFKTNVVVTKVLSR